MKHLLNNLSSEEKNSIREQYEGGMSVDTSKFRSLLESKLGDVKPLISEQGEMTPPTNTGGMGTKDNPYKIKYFYTEDDKTNGNRGGNIDVSDLRLFEGLVEFIYREAGTSYPHKIGRFACDRKKVSLTGISNDILLSDEANKIFQSMCDEYVSTGSKQQNVTLTEQEDVTDSETEEFGDIDMSNLQNEIKDFVLTYGNVSNNATDDEIMADLYSLRNSEDRDISHQAIRLTRRL